MAGSWGLPEVSRVKVSYFQQLAYTSRALSCAHGNVDIFAASCFVTQTLPHHDNQKFDPWLTHDHPLKQPQNGAHRSC